MPLQIKTIRTVLPGSPGWYWFRTSTDAPWNPILVEYTDGKSQAHLVGCFYKEVPNSNNGACFKVTAPIEEFEGEWGDEITPPKQAKPALQITYGSSTTSERAPRTQYNPPANQSIIPAQFEKFLYWIQERHQIYLNREVNNSPKPWTKDPILQNNFFCNPFRELDKTTQWFRNKLRQPLAPYREVLMATIIFRWFNYIPTGEALLHAYDSTDAETTKARIKSAVRTPADPFLAVVGPQVADMRKTLSKAAKKGIAKAGAIAKGSSPKKSAQPSQAEHLPLGLFTNWDTTKAMSILSKLKPVFTSAYVVSSAEGLSKLDSIAGSIGEMWEARNSIYEALVSHHTTMEKAHQFLTSFPGIGNFTAYELVCDLRFTHIGEKWSDVNAWANAGPGAMRGLNRLYGRPISFARGTYDWVSELQHVYSKTTNALLEHNFLNAPHGEVPYHSLNCEDAAAAPNLLFDLPFELREIEHSLCEFDKYMRLYEPVSADEYRPGDVPKQSKRKFKGT